MNLKNKLMGLGLAALVAGSLGAQDVNRWSVGMGYLIPLDSTKTITDPDGMTESLNLDFGYTAMLASTDVPVRISLGINNLPGSTTETLEKRSLFGMYLGADIYIKTGIENLSLVTGINLNKWRLKYKAPGIDEDESVEGVKFGGRLGLDYRINARFSVNLSVNATELGVDRVGMAEFGNQGWNPSWVQVGGRFHF